MMNCAGVLKLCSHVAQHFWLPAWGCEQSKWKNSTHWPPKPSQNRQKLVFPTLKKILSITFRVLSVKARAAASGRPDGGCGSSSWGASRPFWNDGWVTSSPVNSRGVIQRAWPKLWRSNVLSLILILNWEHQWCMISWIWCQRESSRTRPGLFCNIWARPLDAGRPIFLGKCRDCQRPLRIWFWGIFFTLLIV